MCRNSAMPDGISLRSLRTLCANPAVRSFALLDIGSLLGMVAQIPARQDTGMREDCMSTGFRRRRIEDELRLAVLLQNRIVASYHNRAVRIPIRGQAQAKHHKVCSESHQRRRKNKEDDAEEDSPKAVSQTEGLGHEVLIIALRFYADGVRSSLHTPGTVDNVAIQIHVVTRKGSSLR